MFEGPEGFNIIFFNDGGSRTDPLWRCQAVAAILTSWQATKNGPVNQLKKAERRYKEGSQETASL
jgi:hypothetical protein